VSAGATPMLRLRLDAVGRGGSSRAVSRVAPAGRGNRVSYGHSGVREWYTNGPFGLEQGFTLASRPAGSGPLTLPRSGTLARDVGRAAGPRWAVADASLTVLGACSRRYGELNVVDAAGRRARRAIALNGHRVLLRIDDGPALGIRCGSIPSSNHAGADGHRLVLRIWASRSQCPPMARCSPSRACARETCTGSPGRRAAAGRTHTDCLAAGARRPLPGRLGGDLGNGKTIVAGAPATATARRTSSRSRPTDGSTPSGKPKSAAGRRRSHGRGRLGDRGGDRRGRQQYSSPGRRGGTTRRAPYICFTESSHGWQNTRRGVTANVGEPGDDPCDICGVLGGEFGATVAISGGGGTIGGRCAAAE